METRFQPLSFLLCMHILNIIFSILYSQLRSIGTTALFGKNSNNRMFIYIYTNTKIHRLIWEQSDAAGGHFVLLETPFGLLGPH